MIPNASAKASHKRCHLTWNGRLEAFLMMLRYMCWVWKMASHACGWKTDCRVTEWPDMKLEGRRTKGTGVGEAESGWLEC